MATPTRPQRPRIVRRAVHGVLLLDKPLGYTSNDALQVAKRLLRAEKAGHTGTLDPLASGLLPLCFGAATKFAQVSLDADKRYLATLQLGVTTSTGDGEGEITARHDVDVDRERFIAACNGFIGEIDQIPPMHSALKHEGRPLYDLARAGIDVEREPRRVTIHSIVLVAGEGDRWTIDIDCTKGTYIRTLAEDIGTALGCGAHLAALRRTESGAHDIAAATSLAALEAMPEGEREALLLPADTLVAAHPAVTLTPDDAGRFLAGLRRRLPLADAACVRVYGTKPHAFLGTAHIAGGELIASRLLSIAEVSAGTSPALHAPPQVLESITP